MSLDLVADNAKSQMMSLAAKQFKVSTSQLKLMVQQAKLQVRADSNFLVLILFVIILSKLVVFYSEKRE